MTRLDPHSRLGVDVGRVLMCASTDGEEPDISFLEASEDVAMRIPPEPHAFDVVRAAFERTDGHVYVVSKCGARIERRTRLWLEHQRFVETTGVSIDHVHFVRKRPEKAGVAQRLGLTHFIDDRLDVLRPMIGLVPDLVWFGGVRDAAPEGISVARDWTAVGALLIGSAG